ncbi:MAG: PEP/pyruvate-binding domain-containing protein [Candidatus Omnitrophota bacterium]
MSNVSTGIPGLDAVLNGLQIGDNVVWQIDAIEEYRSFVAPFVKRAVRDDKKVVYIRFAGHEPLVKPGKNVVIHKLDPYSGFESFSTALNKIIEHKGEGIYYVFDCLSYLLKPWATDLMIGNFFRIICPYLFALNTIAYFSIIRNKHSFKTVARIRETTQLLIDVYDHEGSRFIHPLKVWNRYSPTMFLPHIRKGERFVPLTNSVDASKLFAYMGRKGQKDASRNLDYWDLIFLEAEELLKKKPSPREREEMTERLCSIMIARDEKMRALAKRYLTLEDLIEINSRLIGTGFIGGKAVGMLLSRKILLDRASQGWKERLEPHDSFYIGSDVFYTYIVQNGWWKLRMDQKTEELYFTVAAGMKDLLLKGDFPDEIKEQFREIIEYFGQSPMIVRSSSLLEDSFGNAFAGKYESIFCANQGSPEKRYQEFIQAVRRIYASTMNEDALNYRLQRGLDKQDEQMALLVQRVSGSYRKHFFFPDVSGVGISYNTFVWKSDMDPSAGALRIVAGLGTRAVNRVEGDYPRIVALDAPLLKPHADMKEIGRFFQHYVDLINIKENVLQTVPFETLVSAGADMAMDLIAVRDYGDAEASRRQEDEEREKWVITFDKLLGEGPFVKYMKEMLGVLEDAYDYPVDIEFTVNFKGSGIFQINLLQCRPHQTKGIGRKVGMPKGVRRNKIFFESIGHFMGGNISQPIRRIIYVEPERYSKLSLSSKYDIARLIGVLNREIKERDDTPAILIGPGRWGTTTPSMGVPVSFSEIDNMAVLCELAFATANCIPELSFGTHFFQDLVESDIFYTAIFPGEKGTVFNRKLISSMPNILPELAGEYAKYKDVVRVADAGPGKARLVADIVSQKVVFFSP